MTVDGTHCPINEPKPFSSKWSSHKFGGAAALNYEIGLRINRSQCVWINGPFPAGTPDINVFKKGLMARIPVGKKVIGDRGYRGVSEIISTQNYDFDPREISEFKERALARHETFNKRIKTWDCLTTKWRQSHNLHKSTFEAICVLQQYEINNESQKPLLHAYP